ncbi:unnamed protein product [Owenia fusiformis]|uniref:Purple acid phosphatase n=1 Tax=Owenia fusiformis TaxID=6347 RepID=A0A8J1Y481_OWEFU|nr:unnamed protein product [Owenia fusiformis]
MEIIFLFVVLSFVTNVVIGQPFFPQPEQVHLSYAGNPTEMVVTWVTQSATNSSIVQFGIAKPTQAIIGKQELFKDGGSEARLFYIHRVTLFHLTPGMSYKYRCGSELGWSDMYSFTAMQSGTNWSPRFALYGDMGNTNAKSVSWLQQEAQDGNIDAILHVGDFAYNMDTDNARTGDEFMRQIEPIAAYVPYMTCVGNHENAYNFSNYRKRFTMPGGDGDGLFFSFDIGPVHIISFSTEVYYYVQYGWMQIVNQYKWLEEDLKKANLPENRSKRPWIITMGHRPMYCSNSDDPPLCTNVENPVRIGIPYIKAFGLEDLFYKYGVDLQFYAHEHSYERLYPVYNRTVCNGTSSDPYKNPRAPVHIVTGSAGCTEGEDPFIPLGLPWSAFRSDDYGYTRMRVVDDQKLYMEQVSVDKKGTVVDKVLITKEKHGMGLYDCHQGR